MGGQKLIKGDELRARVHAWGDEWRAVAASTAPADRPRAEQAIRSLYANAGEVDPIIAWVPSPSAGLNAYAFASQSRRAIASAYARGDIGNGANREFNALADPFPIEPDWARRLANHVRDRIPARPEATRLSDPVEDAAENFGFRDHLHLRLIREVAAAAARGVTMPETTGDHAGSDQAAAVLGDTWLDLVTTFGSDLARGLFAEGVRRMVVAMVTDPSRIQDALQAMQPGQWDTETPVLAAARDVLGGYLWRPMADRASRELLIDARLEIARSAGPWWALEGLAIVSERPLVQRRDDRSRPHRADAAAVAWPDGDEVYAWHGVRVEPWVITDPARITVEAIDAEQNAEVRRVLVEQFGEDRLVREGGAQLIHEDGTGRLWERPIGPQFGWGRRDESLVMVEVTNSTPEPDGTRKTYFLRVPPLIRKARDAVAWTFGLDGTEYEPQVET